MTHDELRDAVTRCREVVPHWTRDGRYALSEAEWAELLAVLDAIPGLLDDLSEKNRLVELLGALARNQAEPRTKGAER